MEAGQNGGEELRVGSMCRVCLQGSQSWLHWSLASLLLTGFSLVTLATLGTTGPPSDFPWSASLALVRPLPGPLQG